MWRDSCLLAMADCTVSLPSICSSRGTAQRMSAGELTDTAEADWHSCKDEPSELHTKNDNEWQLLIKLVQQCSFWSLL